METQESNDLVVSALTENNNFLKKLHALELRHSLIGDLILLRSSNILMGTEESDSSNIHQIKNLISKLTKINELLENALLQMNIDI
jgi:hypothetical protein